MALAKKKQVNEVTQAEFNQLCNLLRNHDIMKVALLSGVHFTTLYKWLDGKTYSPRLITLIKVANAIGYRFKLVKQVRRK